MSKSTIKPKLWLNKQLFIQYHSWFCFKPPHNFEIYSTNQSITSIILCSFNIINPLASVRIKGNIKSDIFILKLRSICFQFKAIQVNIPRFAASFVGTGDLFTALSTAWIHKTQVKINYLKKGNVMIKTIINKQTLQSTFFFYLYYYFIINQHQAMLY